MELHPKKITIEKYNHGVDFLGYVCFPHHRILRTKTKKRLFAKICYKNWSSYLGVLRCCSSRGIQTSILVKMGLETVRACDII